MDDLIDLFEISENGTLKDLGFEAVINVRYSNGQVEDINVPLPDIIMNATVHELKKTKIYLFNHIVQTDLCSIYHLLPTQDNFY